MHDASIRRVSFYWSWIGGMYSSPEHRVIHLDNGNDCFLRRDSACSASVPVDIRLVAQFLATLQEPIAPILDLDRMGLTASWMLERAPVLIERRCRKLPTEQARRLAQEGLATLKARPDLEAVLRNEADGNFNSCWTNDYPQLRVKILTGSDNVVLLDTSSQHSFMLPWTICDVAAGTKVETYDADLSRAVARLLPDDFPGYTNLTGESLANMVLWEVLGELMVEPRPGVEEQRETPIPVPASRSVDCALLEAARKGQAVHLQGPLSTGANLDCRDEEGRTPLMLAVLGGHSEAVSALLAAGADVEARDNDGYTPLLHSLPQSASMSVLMSILDKEEMPDGRDHVGLLEMLLKAGADPNGANSKYGTTPILKVSEMKQKGALTAAQRLIDAGARVNVADDVGQTALMHAAFPPFDWEMFWLLVRAGADPESRRKDGCTGLVSAASGGETESARAWIKAGADVNAPGPNGNTPLMLAAQGWPDIVEALLAAGADVNATDADGDTALHFAVLGYRWSTEQEKSVIVKRLLAAGAKVRTRNRKGHTALTDLLRLQRAQEIEEEVQQAFRWEPQGCEPDVTAPVQGASELSQLLRAAGCEP